MSSCSSSSRGSEADNWSDWQEEPAPTKSLFDASVHSNAEEALRYDAKNGIDLLALVRKLDLSFHETIKLINYLRSNAFSESIDKPTFSDDKYLIPVIEDDPLLQVDFEELALTPSASISTNIPEPSKEAKLKATIRHLEDELLQSQSALLEMRSAMQTHLATSRGFDMGSTSEAPSKGKDKALERDDHTHYFASYACNEIHEVMLKDAVRTDSYRDFILSNPSIFKDAIVLDVGCGTGILSMFAAKAGAKHVFAVDASDIAHMAKRNIKENGLDQTITVIKGKVEEIQLPVEKVDVIISEWMGYFLLYESMLDSVLHARDRFLRPGGLMAPSQCSILACLISDTSLMSDKVTFWDDVYGFKMSAMKDDLHSVSELVRVKPEAIVSSVEKLHDLHVQEMKVAEVDFEQGFEMQIQKDATVHGLLGWFDTWFARDGRIVPSLSLHKHLELSPTCPQSDLQQGEVSFTTGPLSTETHWRSSFFLFKDSLVVKKGDIVKGTFVCKKNNDNSRELEVTMSYSLNGGEVLSQVWKVQ